MGDQHRMRADYQQFSDQDELLSCVAERSPKTVICDVEPLVALWDTGTSELSGGVERLATRLSAIHGIEFLGFVTNSRRHISVSGPANGPKVFYVSSAHKPLLIQPYRRLPHPGAVIGDQLATDGIFAWRLGFDFLQYNPGSRESPTGVRIMHLTGNLLRPLFFNASASGRAPG